MLIGFRHKNRLDNLHLGYDRIFILTVTSRLAAFLRNQYSFSGEHKAALASGQLAVLSFASWLNELWTEVRTQVLEVLLSEAQEHALWQKVIQDTATPSLGSIENTVKFAVEAWTLVQSWKLPFPFSMKMASENSLLFEKWATAFRVACRDNDWITASELPYYLGTYFQSALIKPPKKMILVGFSELSPALQTLLQILTDLGVQIEHDVDEFKAEQISRVEFDTTDAEILAMAHWAKKVLRSAPSGSLIGCVVPELEQRRTEVLQAFNRVFWGEHFLFNLSAPIQFDKIPLITIALKLFELGQEAISLQDLGLLLRTPFIGASSSERLSRAKLDVYLRHLRGYALSVETVLQLSNQAEQPFYCPAWQKQVNDFRGLFVEDKAKKHLPSWWGERISLYLAVLGWPGEKLLNHEQRQVMQRFQEVLNAFSGLDVIYGEIDWEKARVQLANIMANSLFQYEPQALACIQIVGAVEAVGIAFEKAWVLGLTDEIWPPTPQPNPFIPFDLQTQFDIPHSSAAREWQFSKQLTEQFCQLAPQVIFSSARFKRDVQQRPSPLLSKVEAVSLAQLGLEDLGLAHKTSPADHCEYLMDQYAPAIDLEKGLRGGVSLFKLQAACPFRAFAEIRLRAKGLEKIQVHFDKKDQGALVHRVIELIWSVLKTQKKMLSYSYERLHQLVENKVDFAIQEFCGNQKAVFKQGFNRIEHKRLTALIENWFQIHEKRRPDFSVLASETSVKIALAGFSVDVRIDRIDVIENQKNLIIDYKTGFVSTQDWLGERPNEPQLPLYCVGSQVPVNGILFAQIKAGALSFKGLAEEGVEIQGVEVVSDAAWRTYQEHWKKHLENLAMAFSKGYAAVEPKESATTCRFCDLKAFCRVNEV